MADRNGLALRRWLASAEAFSDSAIARGLSQVNTPKARSSALLCRVTAWDHCGLPDEGADFGDLPMTVRPNE